MGAHYFYPTNQHKFTFISHHIRPLNNYFLSVIRYGAWDIQTIQRHFPLNTVYLSTTDNGLCKNQCSLMFWPVIKLNHKWSALWITTIVADAASYWKQAFVCVRAYVCVGGWSLERFADCWRQPIPGTRSTFRCN